jgi:hypothetical protein
MFDTKQTALFKTENTRGVPRKPQGTGNAFLDAGMKKSAEVLSGNGALKYDTTGDDLVDQFGASTKFRKIRSFTDIAVDQSIIWAIASRTSVMFILFLRMITRVTMLFDGSKTSTVQRGQGLRHEGLMRMIWLHMYHPDTFWKNIHLFISVGSWKDVFQMLQYDLSFNGWENRALDWDKFKDLILAGLAGDQHSELVKKYLPQIKTRNKCKTVEAQADNLIGKWIAEFIRPEGLTKTQGYKHYRKLKSNGTAHTWQQLISQGKHLSINFDTVHGRALSLLVGSKYLQNQGLEEEYLKWIESKPVAKFTGYVHELFGNFVEKDTLPTLRPYREMTLIKQFQGLVETAQANAKTGTSMIVVRDTSHSMTSLADGVSMTCYSVGKALALFFSQMLPDGIFANSYIEFADTATLKKWKGSTIAEQWRNDTTRPYGGTNFQSVIDLFIHLKRSGVEEHEFPTGILCISDGEFNPAELGQTNVAAAKSKLANVFSIEFVENFQIVLWNLGNTYYSRNQKTKFETHGDVKNVFYFSGYDPSIIAFLTGVEKKDKQGNIVESRTPKTAKELFNEAMDQEVLNMVEI